ncbi:MAG: MGMT family protein [Sphaerochaetaceae bacterium]|nr:MGMT family protein [Spirochaetales bacterium]MDY5499932.1 MGMT family protein [Sphaerochaetaceae bacterium]
MNDDRLVYEVLAVVGEIPVGRVATYGQIARLVGRPKNSRMVGNILKYAEQYGDYPCHRVVNHAGRLAPLFHAQRSRLEAEGVRFNEQGHVLMKDFQWDA